MFYVKPPADDAPESDLREWADRECQVILTILESIEMGIMVRLHGLIWRVPLCHDDTDY